MEIRIATLYTFIYKAQSSIKQNNFKTTKYNTKIIKNNTGLQHTILHNTLQTKPVLKAVRSIEPWMLTYYGQLQLKQFVICPIFNLWLLCAAWVTACQRKSKDVSDECSYCLIQPKTVFTFSLSKQEPAYWLFSVLTEPVVQCSLNRTCSLKHVHRTLWQFLYLHKILAHTQYSSSEEPFMGA